MLQISRIALGSAMDAFAVSISSGMCLKSVKPWQAPMPAIGWALGSLAAMPWPPASSP
jgi:putative Mn2+ efflux pump MntP